MCEIYSKFRRKQNNIKKSIYNEDVNQLFNQHYRYLYSKLVYKEEDRDTFNDTFLKLTYNYNPDKDFIDQFIYYFKLLKGAYYRDSKVENYHFGSLEGIEIASPDEIDEEPIKKKQISITDLKQKVQEYANFKKNGKRASKKD